MVTTDSMKGQQAEHALLSASSSHRWLECTPSAVAESVYPDAGSDFAREGSLAHALGAMKLKRTLGRDTRDEDMEIEDLAPDYLTGEMEEHAEGYASYVMGRYAEACRRASEQGTAKPEILVEARLDFSDWVPGGFGTGDAVIIGGGMVEVIDLKYGKGVEVSAERNSQMMLYALGACVLMDYAYDIGTVRMTIYQPRLGNISEWETGAGELMDWAEHRLRPLASVAALGLGARKSGAWCRFCKAKGDCARFASDSLSLWELNRDTEGIPTEVLPEILEKIPMVKDWAGAVEERSLNIALSGTRIEGYKLVEGRSVRRITDTQGAADALVGDGATEVQVWRPRELRTLTELERTFGKKRFAELCGSFIEKPRGKPALVPESDRRKAIDPAADFDGMDI